MVRREIVGAHYGLRDWLAQRVTAVIMLVYTALIVSVLIGVRHWDYWQWKALWQVPVVRYATLLVLVSLLLHAWVGMRNIFMDYIKPTGLRLVLYGLAIGALAWYAAWSVQILWGLNGASG